ncbi:MAG: amidohydrolase [Planctomycetes bacterium]|nr:amidohydrolase [Planctomycetota bacterium]
MIRSTLIGVVLSLSVVAQSREVLITGARVLDTSASKFIDDHAVLVRDGRIAQIAPVDEFGATLRRIELKDRWLVPGLIDLHSHLVLYPYDRRSWNDQVMKESLELRTIRGVVAANRTLEAGWTTLRDLGTEGAGFADVAIRDGIRAGLIRGPRIVAVTRAIVATGCYGPSGFAPRLDIPKGAQVADGVDGCRKAVREQIAAGADWIKVYADYRRKPGDPSTPTFSHTELVAIVQEATSAGVKVSAHAVTDEAIRRAVRAGVGTIEHGYLASTETFLLMKATGCALCPTLAASEAIARYNGWRPGRPDHARIKTSKTMFRRALSSGVHIACGSDVGVFAHGTQARELELMHAYGMPLARVLRSATIDAAAVLDDAMLGRIAKGGHADLIALRKNPLEDVAAYREVAFVMKGGGVFVKPH